MYYFDSNHAFFNQRRHNKKVSSCSGILFLTLLKESLDKGKTMTNSSPQKTPYELLGKEEGIRKLATAFYRVMDELPEAEHIRKMHAESLVDIEEKLFEYLNGWFGGPHLYQEKYGTICLTDPHKPYTISEDARDQWLQCWDEAMTRVGASEETQAMIKMPIFRMADFMVNQRSEACP